MEEITACTMDCPDTCSLRVETGEGGSVRIRGNREDPFTSGFICRKIRHHVRRLRSPSRILHPLRRKGETWEPIEWEAALDLCAEKIDAYRREPASILHIPGSGGRGVLKQAAGLFFSLLGSSRVLGSLCDAAGFMACVNDFGSRVNHDASDLQNARRIVNWGKDLSRGSIHMAAAVRKARRRGARLLTVSPGGDGNGPFSDAFLRILPGTDRFLAAAVIRKLVERNVIRPEILEATRGWERFRAEIVSGSTVSLAAACGLTEDDIDPVVAFYSDPGPTATLVGTGIQRYRYGGENVRFINALALLSGNIGRSGGGTYYHAHSLRHLNNSWAEASGKPVRRSLHLPLIGSEIRAAADPPIRMIWVNGSNIVNQAADTETTLRAFEKVEFKVVVDAFMTDTAAAADLILPSTLMLEQEDIVTSFFYDCVHHVRAVLPAPGEVKSDHWILSRIGERLSPPVILPDAETCFSNALDSPHIGISFPELRRLSHTKAKRPEIPYAGLTFAHSDGKYRLPTRLHEEPSPPSGYPLRLLSLIRREAIHSQILPEEQRETPVLSISPENPEAARFSPGSTAWVVSPLGRLKVRIAFLPGLHPAAAVYRRGDWKRFGGGINQLVGAAMTDLGKCAAFYDQYVRIETDDE